MGILLGHFAVDSVQTGISPSYYESVHNMLYSIIIIFILMFCIYHYISVYMIYIHKKHQETHGIFPPWAPAGSPLGSLKSSIV